MQLTAQFPFADMRPFLTNDCRCIEPVSFVRRSGKFQFREETDPGVTEWPDEDEQWVSHRALRYKGEIGMFEFGLAKPANFHGWFRRLFWNEALVPVTRLELGLVRPRPRRKRRLFGGIPKLDGDETMALARGFLAMPVKIPGARATTMCKAPSALARLLLRSTTVWKDAEPDFASEDWWLAPGRPLVLLAYTTDDASYPRGGTRLKKARNGLVLHHDRFVAGSSYCRIWFLAARPGVDPDEIRLLRCHLLRLNAELECLRLVLGHVASRKRGTQLATTGDASARLDRYFEKALGLLSRRSVYGYPPSAFLEQVFALEQEASPAAPAGFESLLERAEVCRPTLASLRQRPEFRREAKFLL